MDSLDLLAREEEFRKLNKQLNKKTESLMKEIEEHMMIKGQVKSTLNRRACMKEIMTMDEAKQVCKDRSKWKEVHKPDIFSDFSHSLILNANQNIKKHNYNSMNNSSFDTEKENKSYSNQRTQIKTRKIINLASNKNDHLSVEAKNIANNNKKITSHNAAETSTNDVNADNHNDQRKCDDVVISNDGEQKHAYVRYNERDDSLEFLRAFVSLSVKEEVLPKSFLRSNISVESVCKCMSSTIKLLHEQIERLQSVNKKKKTQCESHLTQIAEMESERMVLRNKTNNMSTNVAEMKAKCMALQKRFEEKDRLYKEQRGEADKLLSEMKRLKSKNASAEAKCASQEETIDTLKQQLEVAKRAEKEFKDSSRVLSASHENAITRLESQIKMLKTRTEKQMALISNLRKQNAILTTEGALKALEREYGEFLNQDFE